MSAAVKLVAAKLREALDVCVDDGDGAIDPNGLAEVACRALGVTEQIAFSANFSWPTLGQRMNTGRLYHDIADLIYDSPGFIGSVCRSRATAVQIMGLIETASATVSKNATVGKRP